MQDRKAKKSLDNCFVLTSFLSEFSMSIFQWFPYTMDNTNSFLEDIPYTNLAFPICALQTEQS